SAQQKNQVIFFRSRITNFILDPPFIRYGLVSTGFRKLPSGAVRIGFAFMEQLGDGYDRKTPSFQNRQEPGQSLRGVFAGITTEYNRARFDPLEDPVGQRLRR